MLSDHRRVAVCLRLLDLHIAALERGRRGCTMLEEEVRMPRIVLDGEILLLLHVDIARMRRVTAALELREAARNKACRRAVVLVVPCGAVPQIEICLAFFAGKDRARELGVRRRECEACQRLLCLACGIIIVSENIALNVYLVIAEIARLVHIDEDARAFARVAYGAMACTALILSDGQPVELRRAARCCFNASDIIACAALDANVRITDHAHEVVAVVIDAIGLANAIDIHIERFRRNGHRSVAAARRTMSAVIDSCEESERPLLRLDRQRLIVGMDRQRFVRAENCAVPAVGLDRRVLRKCVNALGLFHLVIDVFCDIARGDLTLELRLLLFVRRLGRRGVLIVCALSCLSVVGDLTRPFCGGGCESFVDLCRTCEFSLAVLVLRIGELVRERLEYRLDVAVRDARRLCAERDVRVIRRTLDRDRAALDRRRRRRIVVKDEARVTAVVVDLDVLLALPHDAGFVRRIAARELCEAGSGESSVARELVGLYFMRPCRAVGKCEIGFPIAKVAVYRTCPQGICRREGCVNLTLIAYIPHLHIANDSELFILPFVEENLAAHRGYRPVIFGLGSVAFRRDCSAADGNLGIGITAAERIECKSLHTGDVDLFRIDLGGFIRSDAIDLKGRAASLHMSNREILQRDLGFFVGINAMRRNPCVFY